MTSREPFIGSGRLQEGGALVTRLQDFVSHYEGGGFKHNARSVEMSPSISALGGETVQETLEVLHQSMISSGSGFLSIGNVDGYAQGSYNVGDPSTLTLKDAFEAAFSDVRLTNGGVVFVLAGKYSLRDTVTVPAGISIVGEMGGTIIVGEMQEEPMFIISKPTSSVELASGISSESGSNVGAVKFANITLADNLDGYELFGEPTMTTTAMIHANVSSNFSCENVSFIGRIHSGSAPRTKTLGAISYVGSGSDGTVLKLQNCYFDGLRSGVFFTPNNNEKDILTVNSCKARIYGTEDSSSQDVTLNSFIVYNHCNAIITNNYFVGAGTYANTFINIIGGTATNTKSVVSGNTGKPFSLSSSNMLVDETTSPHITVFSDNNWGNTINDWYITVGSGSGTSPVGDFNGPGAINTILSIASSNAGFSATVIVNPGTYTVDGNLSALFNFANLSFIGNKHGTNYPIFSLSIDSLSTDGLGNRVLALGNKIQSIKFISNGVRHSVRPGFNTTGVNSQSTAHLIEVTDCIFINTSLFAIPLNSKPWQDQNSNLASASIRIRDCYFLQDNTFSDTISLVLPAADEVLIDGCHFKGCGYAISIGSTTYYLAANSSSIGNITISNTICNLTGYDIANSNTATRKGYVVVDAGRFLNIENSQIYASDTYESVAPISSSLTSNATISKFIHLKVDNVDINNSIFAGPDQTFTVGGVNYAMPTLFMDTVKSANIRNSKFLSGAFSLQFYNKDTVESIVIENCYFKGSAQTLLDFDYDVTNEESLGKINIKGCYFENGENAYKVLHSNVSPVYGGAITLFAANCFISFTDNLLYTTLVAINGISNTGSLTIDNVGDQVNTVVISGNTFYTTGACTSTLADDSTSCILCRSPAVLVNNNFLSLYNTASILNSFIGPLYLSVPDIGAGSYSDSIVSNNIFSRRNISGTSSDLARGYIQIVDNASNNRGFIVDNSFDSTTYNGSSTTLVEDNSNAFPDNWTIERNKNQRVQHTVNWAAGNKGISTGADIGSIILYGGAVTGSSIKTTAGATSLVFNYDNSGNQDQFRWAIPLKSVLPTNVRILGVSFNYQSDAVPATVGTITGVIYGSSGSDTKSSTISGTTLVSNSITLNNAYTTKFTDNPYLVISAFINAATSVSITISNVIITYAW